MTKSIISSTDSAAHQAELDRYQFLNPLFDVHLEDLTGPGETDKNVWLYNIDQDPSESVDLSEEFPHIVTYLCERLHCYNCSAVPAMHAPVDMNSLPIFHGGQWTYYVDSN